jgi:hypothetical protein
MRIQRFNLQMRIQSTARTRHLHQAFHKSFLILVGLQPESLLICIADSNSPRRESQGAHDILVLCRLLHWSVRGTEKGSSCSGAFNALKTSGLTFYPLVRVPEAVSAKAARSGIATSRDARMTPLSEADTRDARMTPLSEADTRSSNQHGSPAH